MVVGYHITPQCIANSKGYVKDTPPWLGFLVEDSPGEDKVFYDLDASVAALLRLLEMQERDGRRLLGQKKLYSAPWRLTYYPGKFFSIDEGFGVGHPYANFTNAGQYTDVHYEEDYSPEYTLSKAREAARIGQGAVEAFERLGLGSTAATSPISAFDKKHLSKLNIPTIDDIPEEAGEIAYGCVKGNWLEAWQLGYWEEAWDYDISGAYGAQLAKLLDLRRGRWVRSTAEPEGAVYGFAHGELMTWADFHPFILPSGGEMTYTPVGTWETCLTKQGMDFLDKYKLGIFRIYDAWWWIPEGQQYEFLKGVINWLWEKRKQAEGIDNTIVKRIMAGIWGRMLEVRGTEEEPEFGPYFNPVYAAIVEDSTRMKVAGMCLDQGVVPLHVAVDGMITDKPLVLESRNGLGEWRLSHEGRCIIASSGVVAFEGKHGAEEFSLRFSWLHDGIKARPRAKEYRMMKMSPCSLARALTTDFSQLGLVEEITRSITIGEEPKRMWKDHPKTGGGLLRRRYESAPWEYNIVATEAVSAAER